MLNAYRLYAFSIVSLKRSVDLGSNVVSVMRYNRSVREIFECLLTWCIVLVYPDRHKSCHVSHWEPPVECKLDTCLLVIDL